MFLTRTSCHKITQGNSYYGAWPQWVVLISVLPLTATSKKTSLTWYVEYLVSYPVHFLRLNTDKPAGNIIDLFSSPLDLRNHGIRGKMVCAITWTNLMDIFDSRF